MKNLNREINLNKKVILVLVLVCVLAIVFYYSYALFQISVIKDNVVVITTGDIKITTVVNDSGKENTISGLGTTNLSLNSGETRNVTFNLSTTTEGSVSYKMFYNLLSGTGPFYVTSTTNFENSIVEGEMEKSKSITLRLENKGEDTLKIAVGIKGGLPDSEILLVNGNMAMILNKDLPLSKLTTVLEDTVSKSEDIESDTFKGGLVPINQAGEISKNSDIREYRYIGTEVNNYLKFNDELWRVVGIFNEESVDGLKEKYIKIVKNETLDNEKLPENYIVDSINYKLKGTKASYWNRFLEEEELVGNTDFIKSSIGNYLNTEQDNGPIPTLGYLSTITPKAKIMLRKATYYLGDVENTNINAINLYKTERNVTSNEIYSGTVGLLYPSDLIYSTSYENWDTALSSLNEEQIKTSWLYNAYMKSSPWLITKSTDNNVLYLSTTGSVTKGIVNENEASILPVLTINSNTLVNGGEGTLSNPYILF